MKKRGIKELKVSLQNLLDILYDKKILSLDDIQNKINWRKVK